MVIKPISRDGERKRERERERERESEREREREREIGQCRLTAMMSIHKHDYVYFIIIQAVTQRSFGDL